MNNKISYEKILECFKRYYNVSTENIAQPFIARAEFKSHNEQYFLVKAAKVADIDSNESVFFYDADSAHNEALTPDFIHELAQTAWQRGLENFKPYYGHRNTDVSLIITASNITAEAFNAVKKIHFYKSYLLGFFGWSSFRILAYDDSTGRCETNRRGSDLRKLINSL